MMASTKVPLLLLGCLALGCSKASEGPAGGDIKGSNEGTTAATGVVGPPPPAKMRTVDVTPERAKQGEAAFQACVACHGMKGEGRVGMAPSLTSETFLEAASDDMLSYTISMGRPGTTMAPWITTLGDDNIKAIIAHLRTAQETEPAELDESPLRGDVAAGEKVFQTVCYSCHGRHGGGYQETGSGTGIGRRGFLQSVTNGYLRHLVKHGKSGTPMKAFTGAKMSVANLSDADIENVIAFLRANAW